MSFSYYIHLILVDLNETVSTVGPRSSWSCLHVNAGIFPYSRFVIIFRGNSVLFEKTDTAKITSLHNLRIDILQFLSSTPKVKF